MVGVEPVQAALHDPQDSLGPAVKAGYLIALETGAKFGGDHDLVATTLERPAKQLLVGEWAVILGRVEEGASQRDGTMQCGD
jgi:hypothetical protein